MLNKEKYENIFFKYLLFFENITDIQPIFANNFKVEINQITEKNAISNSLHLIEETKNIKQITQIIIKTNFSKNNKTAITSPDSYYYIQEIENLIEKIARENNTKIYDLVSSKEIKLEELEKQKFPKLTERINIHTKKTKKGIVVHTHGLNKFALPDIEIQDISNTQIAKKILLKSIEKLLLENKTEFIVLNHDIIIEQRNNSKNHFDNEQIKLTFINRMH